MEVLVNSPRCALPVLQGADQRLVDRYQKCFMSQLSNAQILASGFHSLPDTNAAFSATQAVWRFLNNASVTLPMLVKPILDQACTAIVRDSKDWVLVAIDWSNIRFNSHRAKQQRVALSRRDDQGYQLLTALAMNDVDGAPIAPLCLELQANNGVHSTRAATPQKSVSSLESLQPVMDHVKSNVVATQRPTVFIIDREADSAGNYRTWDAAGHHFIVRADDQPQVMYNDQTMSAGAVADALKTQNAFTECRKILYKNRPATQFIAEASVVLVRPATKTRKDKDGKIRKEKIAGAPLPLRLIVSEVRDDQGKVLARWLLLCNLPRTVDAATIALWYYWRWKIENFHKLLKSAGYDIEQWQQETPEAIARRLLITAMSCVVVWDLARLETSAAEPLRNILVRLSGRQMKRGKMKPNFTIPALLAGLGILIPMLALLEEHTVEDLRAMAEKLLPGILQIQSGKSKIKKDV